MTVVVGTGCHLPDLAAVAGEAGNRPAVEEIVVTARKRIEMLSTVPQSIAVLTERDLTARQITTSPELAAAVPGLMWQSILGYATPNIFLRGIGNTTFNANQASPVGIHRDGVYQGSSVTYGFGLFDLDRVEILKGPQGTLFGRNTTGGVINFVTRKPNLAEGVNGEASVTYGRYNETGVEGAAGVPLGPKAAIRIAGQSLYRDGYVTNRNPASGIGHEGKIDMWSARGQMRLETGALDILIGGHGGKNHSDVTPGKQLGVICPPNVSVPRLGLCTDFLGFQESTNLRENFTNTRSYDNVDTWGANGTMTWTSDSFSIVSQTAFDGNRRRLENDSDSGPYTEATTNAITRYHQISEEVRALSAGNGPLTWIVGANYYTDDLVAFTDFNLYALGPGSLSSFFPVPEGVAQFLHQETKSYATFGEFSYVVAPRLTVTAGVRWTHDRRTADTHAFLFDASGLATGFVDEATANARLLAPTIPAMTISRSWSRWSGRGIVSYELTPHILAYAQVAHGFKGGDFNGGAVFAPAEANIVDPEYLTSYELGFKGVTEDRRLSFDVAVFYYDFSKQQVSILVPGSHATLQQLSNAAKTEAKSIEAEGTLRPFDSLLLQAKVSVLDSKFRRFQRDADDPTTNLAGNRTAFSPKFSFAGLARYTVPVANRYALSLQVDTSYKGAHYFSVDNSPALKESGYWLMNSSIEFSEAHGRFSITAWMKNVTGTAYFATGIANSGLGFLELIPGLPRTFGVTVSARY